MYVKFEIDWVKNHASVAVRPIRTDGHQTDGSGDDNTLEALRGPRVKSWDIGNDN